MKEADEGPLVSVVMPAYNSEEFVDDSIGSVVNQTFTDWELIVVDDCSQDSTVEKVLRWTERDSRVRLLRNERNEGPGPSRNAAISHSEGRYLAFLDSDDSWRPEKLDKQLAHIRNTSAPLVFSAYALMNRQGRSLGRVVEAPEIVDYGNLLKNTVIGCLTVMLDREIVDEPRMPDLPSRQPLVLWLRVLRRYGPAHGLNEVLADYRVRRGSVSSNKFSGAKNVWRVYREYEGLGLMRSLYYFLGYAYNAMARNKSSILSRLRKKA